MRNEFAKVSNPNDFVSCSGDLFHVNYTSIVNADGTIELVESGKDNIRDYINSFREQTDISFILRQIELGNTDVLNDKQPMYGDFTQMPKSYAEALQLVMDAENRFMELPVDIRNRFDNDFKQWFAQAGSDPWFEKMDSIIIKPDDSEVKTDES